MGIMVWIQAEEGHLNCTNMTKEKHKEMAVFIWATFHPTREMGGAGMTTVKQGQEKITAKR
jgi:hypothetical protein